MPRRLEQSRSGEPPVADLEMLERLDGHARIRNVLRQVAEDQGTWCGIPMPLAGEQLVIEPSYPHADGLMAMGAIPSVPEEDRLVKQGSKFRNSFFSSKLRCEIIIFEKPDGGIDWGPVPSANHLAMDLRTMGCSDAWGIEQECNALQLLATLLPHRKFKQYLLTGMFLEKSHRSGVTYVFRKLRPTVAIRTRGEETSIMCTLCMHTIGYYHDSFAGALCPTDDVIAALMLSRADEHFFWKKSTQHAAFRPQAGL